MHTLINLCIKTFEYLKFKNEIAHEIKCCCYLKIEIGSASIRMIIMSFTLTNILDLILLLFADILHLRFKILKMGK